MANKRIYSTFDLDGECIYPNYTKPEVKNIADLFINKFMGKGNKDKGFTIITDDGKTFTARRANKNDFIELGVDYNDASSNCWLIDVKY